MATRSKTSLISIIVPVHNEAKNIPLLYKQIVRVFEKMPLYKYEFLIVDDGSTDNSVKVVQRLEKKDKHIRLVRLARNFGKEIATTAGLHKASGQAAIMIDADLQHPPKLIPELIDKWREGYDVVIGRRQQSKVSANWLKRTTSTWFYRLINRISSIKIVPNATDFRLLDKVVIEEFNRFTERNRMTRGLIDWLGFSRAYIDFIPDERKYGSASYTYKSLIKLALTTVVSLSFFPLRLAGYLGIIIVFVSAPLAVFIFIDRYILSNSLNFSGIAIVAIMLLLLIGIVLVCLGLIALYIAEIYGEVVNRPLYVEKRRMDDES